MKQRKKALALLLSAACLGTMIVTLSSCGSDSPVTPVETEVSFSLGTASGKKTLAVDGTEQVTIVNLKGAEESALDLAYSSSDSSVLAVSAGGLVTALKPGIANVIVIDSESGAVSSIEFTVSGTAANGYYNYAGETWDTKNEILGVLEKYAQDTYLTGIPLAGDGQYIMYNDRVQKGVENYIKGYGFGILQYGSLTADLSGETNSAYKRYLHNYQSEDPHTINEYDANSSTITDMSDNIKSSYFGTRLNAAKTETETYPVLSKDDDWTALDASSDASPKATKFKLHVKTGADGLKYSTCSTKYAAYNGREVKLEDYLTPIKLLYTQKFNLYRGAEQISSTYARPIVGAADYWNASANGINDAAFEKVGVKTGTDEKGDFIEFTFATKLTVSDARENIGGSLFQPIPMEFVDAIGGVNKYGAFSEDGTLTPVDTTLSLSPYTLEYWEKDKLVTYKRNPDWIEKSSDTGMYNISGIHTDILTAAKTDTEAAFKEFLANKLDSCSIPGTYLKQYQNDPRTAAIPETTTWKVNVNATNDELWEELFGENGTITKTPKDKYWKTKPIMSNTHFLDGLYYSINRSEFADSQNMTPSQNYLSKAYYFTDDNGGKHYYYETNAHNNALIDRYPSSFGYNLDAAKLMFKLAIQEEVEAGHYAYGTTANPTVISVSAKWMSQNTLKTMGQPITKYMVDAFNSVDPRIQLNIDNTVAGASSDDMYDALEYGQFDLGMGAITGMQAWPLDFFQVLCSDNRSGFCLNWGPDTSVDDGKIFYDGKTWSFNALWEAGTSGVAAVKGEVGFAYATNNATKVLNESAKSVTYTMFYTAIAAQGVTYKLKGVDVEDYATNSGKGTGQALSLDITDSLVLNSDGSFSFTLPSECNFTYTGDYGMPSSWAQYDYKFDVYVTFEVSADGVSFDLTYNAGAVYCYSYFVK
jgi:hypothetical protein